MGIIFFFVYYPFPFSLTRPANFLILCLSLEIWAENLLQGSINTAENLSQQAIQTNNLNQSAQPVAQLQHYQQQPTLMSAKLLQSPVQLAQTQPQQQPTQQQSIESTTTNHHHHHANSESVRFAPESDNEEKLVRIIFMIIIFKSNHFNK